MLTNNIIAQSGYKCHPSIATELKVIMERIDEVQGTYDIILTGVREHNESRYLSVDACLSAPVIKCKKNAG